MKVNIWCFYNIVGASPYDTLMVADAGDVYLTMYDVKQAALDIERQYDNILSNGCKIITMGGDHTITYPILKSFKVIFCLFFLCEAK